MDEVLLRELQQEVCAEPDVEVDVALRGLGLRDVQIQRLVQQLDRLLLVLLVPPADDGLQVGVVGRLLVVLADLDQEVQLLSCVLQLVLLGSACLLRKMLLQGAVGH